MRGGCPRFDNALIRLAFAPRPDASVADRRLPSNAGYWPIADAGGMSAFDPERTSNAKHSRLGILRSIIASPS